MKTKPTEDFPKGAKAIKALTEVLGQSEHVQDLVENCADELSSVNSVLNEELVNQNPPPAVESAIEKSHSVELKVQEASAKLLIVNRGLEEEVSVRETLEKQLAVVTEQGEAARHAALHDQLTGLPNRALFNDRLEHGLAQAQRHDRTLAVMFIDLDNFKSINDAHGHDVGDRVLRTIADRLKENTRSDDTVSRYGGDEFLYLLMEIQHEHDIVSVATKIITAIRAPCRVNIRDLAVTPSIEVSVGISVFPKDGITADALIKHADKAMYRAKRTKSGYAFSQ